MTLDLQLTTYDRDFYDQHIRDFVPERVIDIHTHAWVGGQGDRDAHAGRLVTWPARVAAEGPIEDLLETYRVLLPHARVTPMIFSSPTLEGPLPPLNAYIDRVAREHDLPALALTRPDWSAERFEREITGGRFVGAKVYLSYAPSYLPPDEIRIFDFIPPHQLDVLDQHGWVLMLHIPRSGRLADPVNLAQMVELDRRWPNVRVIIAHVGRAYCEEDVGAGFEKLAETNLWFDISANCNATVFRWLLERIGCERVLFGSDLPILRMRTRRVCEHGRYINIVPRGLYGDVSADPHMREVDPPESERLTLFFYEEIAAFRHAAEAVGLTREQVRAVFYDNARAMLDQVAAGRGKGD